MVVTSSVPISKGVSKMSYYEYPMAYLDVEYLNYLDVEYLNEENAEYEKQISSVLLDDEPDYGYVFIDRILGDDVLVPMKLQY